jgi:hypothetical protein
MKDDGLFNYEADRARFIKREKACSFKWGILAGFGLTVALFALGLFISTVIYV